jgi:hypothetical protein
MLGGDQRNSIREFVKAGQRKKDGRGAAAQLSARNANALLLAGDLHTA